jgi:hypothetical protein
MGRKSHTWAPLRQGLVVLERDSSHYYMALSVHQLIEAGRGGVCIGVGLHTICTFDGEGAFNSAHKSIGF